MSKVAKEPRALVEKKAALEADLDALSAKMQLEEGWRLVQNRRPKGKKTHDNEGLLDWNKEIEEKENQNQKQQIKEINMEDTVKCGYGG